MPRTRRLPPSKGQAGFSMVEMLMAAFILAVGILGLSMLQTMSLKSARGGHSLTNAVGIADRVMDSIEMEGRLSWLNVTNTPFKPPVAITTLKYVGHGTQYLGFQEVHDPATDLYSVEPLTSAPVADKPLISATVRYVATITEGAATAAGSGGTSDYRVTVEFADDTNKTGALVVRSVNILRSILHG